MLDVRELHAFYGKSHILHGVHLNVGKGEIVSLLGRNGVGRSTTIKAIMGQVEHRGSVLRRLCGSVYIRSSSWLQYIFWPPVPRPPGMIRPQTVSHRFRPSPLNRPTRR